MNTLYYGYIGMTSLYWGCVLIFGTPLAQPTITRVYLHTLAALDNSNGNNSWKTELKEVAVHLLWWRPLFGCFLFLDQLLLSYFYLAQKIVQPLFVISGARSGSTTLGHQLDCDDQLCGPPAIFALFPFLSVGMLWSATIGRFVTAEHLDWMLTQNAPEELLVRHELHPMKPDTYDVALFNRQWCGMGGFTTGQHLRSTWQWQLTKDERERTVGMIDEVCKKWLYFCAADQKQQHLVLKGHMIDMVPALKLKYPDAAFVTVMRDPLAMAASMVPFAGSGRSYTRSLAAVDCPWFNHMAVEYYIEYCKQELLLIRHGDLLGVPFQQLITDSSSVMQNVKEWSAHKWGRPVVEYRGSKHEEQLKQHQNRSDVIKEKAWRKSLKSKYPSQKVERMLTLAAEASSEQKSLPLLETSSFEDYRNHMQKLEKKCCQ